MDLYIVTKETLASIAEAIRNKRGENLKLIFPTDFITEINNINDNSSYNGSYVITPTVTPQILNTQQKIMQHNLTINSIPYHETSNLSGGYTAIIGG